MVVQSLQSLTDVERTGVQVAWYRCRAAHLVGQLKQETEQQLAPPGEQLLFDTSYDQRLVDSFMTAEDIAEWEKDESVSSWGTLMMAVRCISLDDALMHATGGPVKQPNLPKCPAPTHPIRQVVILGAGLDARAWRLQWPEGVMVYEVDTGSVEALKQRTLGPLPTRCAARHALTADLSQPQQLQDALKGAAFDLTAPTAWLVEGLIGYLTTDAALQLLRCLHELSVPGSQLILTCPPTPAVREKHAKEGKQLHHTTFEEPTETTKRVEAAGWHATLINDKQLEAAYGIPCWQAQIHAVKT